jgi:hypothetical protein
MVVNHLILEIRYVVPEMHFALLRILVFPELQG